MCILRNCTVFSKIVKNKLKSNRIALRQDVPNRLTRLGSDKREQIEPFVLGLYLNDRTFSSGGPDALQAWDESDAVFVTGPQFNRFVKVSRILNGFGQCFF
jgi:hypothetical protein